MANNTSTIYYLNEKMDVVSKEPKFVKKVIHPRCKKYDFVSKEVSWLKKLDSFDRTPNVVEFYENVIIMEYMGRIINKNNIPSNWKDQIEYIIEKLNLLGVSHNDIKKGEILVKNGKINLIDFQHATNTREEFEILRKQNKTTVRPTIEDDYTMLKSCIKNVLE